MSKKNYSAPNHPVGRAANTIGFTSSGISKGSMGASLMSTGKGYTPQPVSSLQSAGANYSGAHSARVSGAAHTLGFSNSGITRGSMGASLMSTGGGSTPKPVSSLQSAGATGGSYKKK